MQIKALLSYSIIFCTIFLYSCKENPTSVETENIQPGSRDYTWSVDTILNPPTSLKKCWGSSLNNIWTISDIGTLNQTIWHFDGNKWTTDSIYRSLNPSAIFGFNKNDVWIGGNTQLWHFNGSNWNVYCNIPETGYKYTGIQDIWGDSYDDVYATGYKYNDDNGCKPLLLHYDGQKWSHVNTPEISCVFSTIRRAKKDSRLHYISALEFAPEGYLSVVYEFDGKNFKKIYSAPWVTSTFAELSLVGDHLYINHGPDIYQYRNGKWELFYSIKIPDFLFPVSGRSSKDIIVAMYDGVAHYNGSDLVYICRFPKRYDINSNTIFDDGVVITMMDESTGANIIYRGKLKTNQSITNQSITK